MAEPDDSAREIAADWIDRLSELTLAEERELAIWLKASPTHAQAFATMHRLSRDGALLDAVTARTDKVAEPMMVAPRPGSAARRRWPHTTGQGARLSRRQAMAAGVAAALGLPLAILSLRRETADAPQQQFASGIARQKRYALPDGSTLTLDAASSVSTRFTPEHRLLDLQQGGARFDVAHDANRPFEVRTPMARMVALGTSFTVDRLSGAVELRVFEGRVRLDLPGTAGGLVAAAGQWVLVSGAVVQRGHFDPAGYSDWQSHWLDADAMRLDFAIDRLSRYSHAPIRLADPRMAGRSFSGRFRLDEPDRSLALICGLFDLVPIRRGDALYLERTKRGD